MPHSSTTTTTAQNDSSLEPIAIVGIGCRFPGGAHTPSSLWDLLKQPRQVASPIHKGRWNLDKFYHPTGTHHGTTNVTESYFLDEDVDIRHFDTHFFQVGTAEAEAMDPQHRMLLEVVYEAMEDGGFTLQQMQGSDTGVYVGLMCTDYNVTLGLDSNFIPTYTATGVSASNASSRVSYYFDWHGPSMTVDTACSSSLVAMHYAIDQLRSGRSRVAMASGTNLMINPSPYLTESKLNMLSPTGRSRMWDADADGYARGDGVAAVLLKRLSDAIADGDNIHSVIRHSGFMHDGKTKGITMPNGRAQADLICRTYREAGLDLASKAARPQFFEAHGTGTPVGDPQEASALVSAFFPEEGVRYDATENLLVGSIKTILGHTEGTAGLAGVLKACLALKHGQIPPNMLFDRLSPGVAPYYDHLRIPTELTPWPQVSEGQPRRASVNSFGFGGTNAHAILESYETAGRTDASSAAVLPFTFSAASKVSLQQLLSKYVTYLSENSNVPLGDLGYTLACRRSALPYKASFAATTASSLQEKISALLEAAKEAESSSADSPLGVRTTTDASTYLGIFTGQGAQWARMGAELISASPVAHDIVIRLQASLDALPEEHRPSWTLLEQLALPAATSRVGEAAIAQPLCTAVQIVLVDILALTGIHFTTVVGHSSGEIGAAYAAGFLTATDAIRVAYYRGAMTTKFDGRDSGGEKGAMLAVGTSLEDATELCESDDLEGRITVAAVNSNNSVTLSGDESAVLEAKAILEEEEKFVRLLKVDRAYHSHHMLPSAAPYKEAMIACGVEARSPGRGAPTWYSSVYGGKLMSAEDVHDISAEYWVSNMTGTVQFAKALSATAEAHPLVDIAIEVGPHPALKSPAQDVLEVARGSEKPALPYLGTLGRGKNDIESVAELLGTVWASRGPASLKMEAYQASFGKARPQLLSGLPTYAWHHDKQLWWEARSTRNYLRMEDSWHDLLGSKTPDGRPDELRWVNWLKSEEIPWLAGHSLQGQLVYPGAGYLVMCLEACMKLAASRSRPVQLIELQDVDIRKALAIPATGIESVVALAGITWIGDDAKNGGEGIIRAKFSCSSPPTKDANDLVINCCCDVVIKLGEYEPGLLPARIPPVALRDVIVDEFYDAMEKLGYYYDGPFKGINTLKRKLDVSSGTVLNAVREEGSIETSLLLHPGTLDSILQAIFAAYSAPGDNRLWAMHAPRVIRRITLVPGLCGDNMAQELSFDTLLTETTTRNRMVGDIDVYTPGFEQKLLEIEGLTFVPLSTFQKANDRLLFAQYSWVADAPNGERALAECGYQMTPEGLHKAKALERMSLYYLIRIRDALAEIDLNTAPAHRRALKHWADHVIQQVESGSHPYIPTEWMGDDEAVMEAFIAPFTDDADTVLGRAVGQHLPEVIRTDGNIWEHMIAENRLDRYYEQGLGLADLNNWIAQLVSQIAQRYPQMAMIEIGAGTGGCTKGILAALGDSFASYTFTDISPSFFEKAKQRLASYIDRIDFKPLNISLEPSSQGFTSQAYDLAVAGNVLHATPDLADTLRNTRALLRPGGYLVAVECIDNTAIRAGFVQGGLEGWWIGAENGRPWGPTISLPEWDHLLKANGFCGVETATPVLNGLYNQAAVWLAMAASDDFRILRNPLASQTAIQDLVLLGTGPGLNSTGTLAKQVRELLLSHKIRVGAVYEVGSLESLQTGQVTLPEKCTTLSLVELDSSVFDGLTADRWEGLKTIFRQSSSILWLTAGARNGIRPHAAMTAGLIRTVANEMALTTFQMLDVDKAEDLPATTVAESLVRLAVQHGWRSDNAQKNMLWTLEPELALEGDVIKILRIVADDERNDRYNSSHRRITKTLALENGSCQDAEDVSVVNLAWSQKNTCWEAKEDLLPARHPSSTSDLVQLDVDFTILSSLHTPAGWLFLALGTENSTGDKYISLTPKQASRVIVPKCHAVPVGSEYIAQPYMSYVTGSLFCHRLLSVLVPGASIVINAPDPVFAGIFANKAAPRGISVVFTTTNPARGQKRSWVYLHPRAPVRLLTAGLPRRIDAFIDMSGYNEHSVSAGADDEWGLGSHGEGSWDQQLAARIRKHLPALAARYDMSLCCAGEAELVRIVDAGTDERTQQLLVEANQLAVDLIYDIPDGMPLPMVSLADISADPSAFHRDRDLRVVDWEAHRTSADAEEAAAPVEVEVEPIDRRSDLFKSDETYWLVGLAGDMGRSLCDWMATKGARHIVLSSRNPQLPGDWLSEHENNGVRVVGVAADVTSLESIKRAKGHIRSELGFPRIAGVANGAMVLRDKPMFDTDLSVLQEVLRPKVEGSMHLDGLFSGNDMESTLDWFVMLTSFASVIGNMGQMAYASANSFQTALVRNRRARGLPGTAIDINMVVGVGYIERERQTGRIDKHAADRLLHRSQLLPICEPDLHQLFAEAVLGQGRVSGGTDPEFITGLQTLTTDQAGDTFWGSNPKFSHWIRDAQASSGSSEGGQQGGEGSRVPLRTRIAGATGPEQVSRIVQEALMTKMRLGLSSEALDEKMPLVDLGVDSLVAVMLRNWSMQEMGVDVPVLKTLGGDSAVDIVAFIVEKLEESGVIGAGHVDAPVSADGAGLKPLAGGDSAYGSASAASTPASSSGRQSPVSA